MKKTLIIAEAGVNHNGDLQMAKELIKVAAIAGADVVKFQTFSAEKLVSQSAQLAEYQERNMDDTADNQLEMLKKIELPRTWHHELKKYADELGILFCSTPFDEDALDFLCELGIPFIKIPSGEITNKPFLQRIASKNKQIILSTGMASMAEVNDAINVLLEVGLSKEKLTVLHCNTEYPTPFEDVNLRAMLQFEKHFGVKYGYSDHTLGSEVAIAAVTLGASVIEKHFTLNKNLPGPDHKASLEPNELSDFIQFIRNVEKIISGSGVKEPSRSEAKNKVVARKSIHLRNSINEGQFIAFNDLEMKRPGDGISPMDYELVLSKKVKRNINAGEQLKWEDFE
ncbi:MAG: N,N-diacetyllegionaminic acid synthase [Bacteroidota bacterium]|jgi:N-acetylneuraminate synthase/N,N'-diacetyllegionaminate synthase